MEKKKILLAVGHRQLEEFLEKELKEQYDFVGPTVHREGVLKLISQTGADIVVIRETLEGTTNIMTIVYNIRSAYPNIRIVFLAGNRKPGDELLSALVSYGVYDILYGANIPASSIIEAVKKPKAYVDVSHLQPVPILDEKRNKLSFEVDDVDDDSEEDETDEPKVENTKKRKDKKETKENSIIKMAQGLKIPQIPTISHMKERSVSIDNTKSTLKNRVVTFIGGKAGVGSSSVAVNVAVQLANLGNRVIYLEANEKYPAISYWYELGLISEGIDTAIDAIEEERYIDVKDAIVRSVDIKKMDSPLKSSYKKFPDTLDFMFFSKEYITGMKPKMSLKLSKELYMHLLYQESYDFVILDVQPEIDNYATINSLMFSNLIFSVITQDVSSIGYHLFHLNELEKKGMFMAAKNRYIVNKYEDSDIGVKAVKEWLDTDRVILIPYSGVEFTNANLKGLPVSIFSNNQELKNGINKIITTILGN